MLHRAGKASTRRRPVNSALGVMKRHIAALALLPAIAFGPSAEAQTKSRFTSADPRLKLIERSDSYEKGSFARWSGRLELDGKVVVEFDRPDPDGERQDEVGVVFFEPSPSSLRRLPSAVGRYYPLQPKVLWLGGTPAEVLTPLLGATRVANFISSKPSRFEVAARLRLLELFTSVECDHRSYEIKYEALALVGGDLMAVGKAQNIGC